MKDLRQGRNGKKDSGRSAKNLETIVVQRLSAEVSGKGQKYCSVEACKFVSFEDFDKLSSDGNGGDRPTQPLTNLIGSSLILLCLLAQSDGKSANRVLPVLDPARGRDSWR